MHNSCQLFEIGTTIVSCLIGTSCESCFGATQASRFGIDLVNVRLVSVVWYVYGGRGFGPLDSNLLGCRMEVVHVD